MFEDNSCRICGGKLIKIDDDIMECVYCQHSFKITNTPTKETVAEIIEIKDNHKIILLKKALMEIIETNGLSDDRILNLCDEIEKINLNDCLSTTLRLLKNRNENCLNYEKQLRKLALLNIPLEDKDFLFKVISSNCLYRESEDIEKLLRKNQCFDKYADLIQKSLKKEDMRINTLYDSCVFICSSIGKDSDVTEEISSLLSGNGISNFFEDEEEYFENIDELFEYIKNVSVIVCIYSEYNKRDERTYKILQYAYQLNVPIVVYNKSEIKIGKRIKGLINESLMCFNLPDLFEKVKNRTELTGNDSRKPYSNDLNDKTVDNKQSVPKRENNVENFVIEDKCLEIPEGTMKLDPNFFERINPDFLTSLSSIEKIITPKCLQDLSSGYNPFYLLTNLKEISFHSSKSLFFVETNCIYKKNEELVGCLLGNKMNKKVHILSGIKTICNKALAGAKDIVEVIIPDGVEIIGGEAFANIPTLRKVYIPKSVKTIYANAFDKKADLLVTYEGSSNEFSKIFMPCPSPYMDVRKSTCNVKFLNN